MKVLIVDDHTVVREALAAMLQQPEAAASVFLAGNLEEGLALAEAHRDLDAIILDLIMPGVSGMDALFEFRKHRPELPVIVLSASEDPRDVRRALTSGALGYVPKSAGKQTLLWALKSVFEGNVYVPPLLINEERVNAGAGDAGRRPDAGGLTERQIEVLRLVCRGQSNKEISSALGLSEKTVKAHVTAIFKALGVVNRTQAATAAQKAGLV
jgi:two-component system, NarL family, nitrate/nitrite response regulator NarL